MVRWTESVALADRRRRRTELVELGTGKVLTGLAKRIAPERPPVPSARRPTSMPSSPSASISLSLNQFSEEERLNV